MVSETARLVIVLIVLGVACTIYAVVLEKHPEWYLPDHTDATVVIGVGLIWLAQLGLELWGVPLNALISFLTILAAGIPILIWQSNQRARKRGRRAGRSEISEERRKH